jgi:hypothetical protein
MNGTYLSRSKAFLVLLIPLCIAGCFNTREPASTPAAETGTTHPPFPTKDDVALVDGKPFSLSTYMAIRSILQHASVENTFWVGVAVLAIQSDREKHGKPFKIETALNVARYALNDLPPELAGPSLREFFGETDSVPNPAELRQKIDRLVSQAVVQRNPQVLADLH